MIISKYPASYISPVDVLFYMGKFLLVMSVKNSGGIVTITYNSFYNRDMELNFREDDLVFIINRSGIQDEIDRLTS